MVLDRVVKKKTCLSHRERTLEKKTRLKRCNMDSPLRLHNVSAMYFLEVFQKDFQRIELGRTHIYEYSPPQLSFWRRQ